MGSTVGTAAAAPRRGRGVTLGLALAALASTILAVGSAQASPPAEPGRSEHDRIVEFWTPERVARAVPRDFERDARTGRLRPAARPGGGGGTSTTVAGASYTRGGAVVETTGKVLFAMGTSYYVCSGSVVTDAVTDRSIVLTAAHCVFDETNGRFATNWLFIPNYDASPTPIDTAGAFCATTKHGCWTASSLVVSDDYATAGSFNDQATLHDYAFAVLRGGGKSGTAQLDDTVGGQAISFTAVANSTVASLFGYPASGKYKGNDLVWCQGPLGRDPLNANLTYRVGCNMTGGSSGGPWLRGLDTITGRGTLMSVNSYGYSGITAMHGPVLTAETQAMFGVAGSVGIGTNVRYVG